MWNATLGLFLGKANREPWPKEGVVYRLRDLTVRSLSPLVIDPKWTE